MFIRHLFIPGSSRSWGRAVSNTEPLLMELKFWDWKQIITEMKLTNTMILDVNEENKLRQ